MENEDEVLYEKDVFISKNPSSSNINIFKYSFNYSPLAQDNNIIIRARPSHKLFEFENKIDTKSKNYDKSKSEHLAMFADCYKNDKQEAYFPDKIVNKQKFTSTEIKPSNAQYYLAVVKDDSNEVHLTPVETVIKFRSNLSHFDKTEIHVKNNKKSTLKEDSELSSQDESEPIEDVKAITMRFAASDEERLKKAREKSYFFLQQQIAKDPWINMNYHDCDSEFSNIQKNLVLNSSTSKNIKPLNGQLNNFDDYLKSLKMSANSKDDNSNYAKNFMVQTPSHFYIKTLPLPDQVRLLLINAKLLSYKDLTCLLSGNFDSVSILRNLQMFAILIQGNWVVKSEVLYNKETCSNSPFTGISCDILCRTRNFILWKFTNSNVVSKDEILEKAALPQEDLISILSQISRYNSESKSWKFLLPTDDSFIEKHPDIVQRQRLLYPSLKKLNIIENIKTEESIEDNKSATPNNRKRRRSSTRRNSTASISSDDFESSNQEQIMNLDASNEDLVNEIKSEKTIIDDDNFTIPSLFKDKRKAKNAKYACLEISPTSMVYGPSIEEKKEITKIIQDLLKINFILSIDDLKKSINEKIKAKIPLVACDNIIENLVNESGGFKVSNKWPQNSVKKTLFAFTKFNDNLENLRDILFEMFTDNTRVRVTHFTEKVRDKFGDKNCLENCKKLLKDYCVHKSGLYYLKGTIHL